MVYMGSKSKLAQKIISLMPTAGRAYVEPFAGGMNLICQINDASSRWANDSNHYVVAAFQSMVQGWVPDYITREKYLDLKNGVGSDREIGWAGTACSFRGKWFGGYAGTSGKRNYQNERYRNVLRQIPLLNNVVFTSMDYRSMKIPDGAVVYCDPPYRGTSGYRDDFDHDAFFEWARHLSMRCDVFISEYSAPADFYEAAVFDHKCTLSSGTASDTQERIFRYDRRAYGV